MIYGHGDDLYRYNGKIKHNFSSNVYYKGCPLELLTKISSALSILENYPSPTAAELNEMAARKFRLHKDQFLFTNGATEAFYLIAHLFSGASAAIVAPTFSEYENACKIHGLDYHLVDKTRFNPNDYQVVFICNPNNPDGTFFSAEVLTQLIEEAPDTTFVIDEAYIEFTDQIESLGPLVKGLNNLIVVRSLTKTFAVPGIRLGYIISCSRIIEQLLSKKMPWSVNALAIQTGLQVFEHYDRWLFNIEELLQATREFIRELSAIPWLQVKPTYTTYFLVELKKGTASALKEFLATQHGILIRDATNFQRLHGEHIRLSTQSPGANAALIKALRLWN
ncbi:aminotransferase class I/II-fold pyridoxal phosphate-dependent enzyme [Ulvibacterium sp.]|uniref:pyridoxal phosphate-dependent aminotransferase n=1 Tax=Ulvibacterium sp. TaxID=2665914 RepID=UPI00262B02D2|nr:aminotransferase class I/II-fold pyridoxal phosphate-dependent enzyme [Ulvibacterium sp.]